ncbi:MAG: ferredoxin [Opitutaceae bacterium]
MSLQNFTERWPENVKGKYYVDEQCLDCDLCRETAPKNFKRNDDGGYSYISKQPSSADDIELLQEAIEGCPCEAIHSDGDQFDWDEILPSEGMPPEVRTYKIENKTCACCTEHSKKWWQFWK